MKCLSRDAGGSWEEYLYSAFESEPHIRIFNVAYAAEFGVFILTFCFTTRKTSLFVVLQLPYTICVLKLHDTTLSIRICKEEKKNAQKCQLHCSIILIVWSNSDDCHKQVIVSMPYKKARKVPVLS